jgi:glycerophosphoryl diester phosphodiesterase
VKIIAHRGASARAPENTLAAVRLAVALKADGVEVDVRLTRDGKLAVLHDADTRRVAPGQQRRHASTSTLTELQMLDVGAWKHPQFAGEYVPELREVVEVVGKKQEIFIEVKSRGYKGVLAELDKVLAPPARGGFPAQRAVVMSFNGALVRKIKKARPGWRVLLLLHGQPTPRRLRRIMEEIRAKAFDGIGQSRRWALADEDYAELRAAGAMLSVWTVDKAAEVKIWKRRKFHYLTTNRPPSF